MPYYPPSGSSYPYSAYHPPPPAGAYNTSHVQQPGAYPASAYQTPYPTAVQGYGTWPYAAYSYYAPPQQQQQAVQQQAKTTQAQVPKPATGVPAVKPATPAPTTAVPQPTAAQHQATSTVTTPISTTAPTYSTSQYATTSTIPTSTASMTTFPATQPPRPYTSTYTYIPSYRDTLAAASTGGARGSSKKSSFRGLFTKELRNLMYGFGDDRNPANDTVNVMEEILVEYIVDVCQTALAPGKKSRLSIEDLRRALSRPADAKKLARMEELLFMQEDIKRARAQFEESDMPVNQASFQS